MIQAYRAAMQTQWSWILQLCHCVEQHLKDNAVYFDVSYTASFSRTHFHDLWQSWQLLSLQFFSDAKESLDYLRNLQDAIHRKYSCDRSSSLHRLEDLIQESMVSSLTIHSCNSIPSYSHPWLMCSCMCMTEAGSMFVLHRRRKSSFWNTAVLWGG